MDRSQMELLSKKNPFMSLNDIVYEIILKDILSFELKPGQKLNETTISGELNISRTPVRCALQKLAEKDYVCSRNSRYYVTDFSRKEYDDIMDTAVLLESYITGVAATKITQDQLKDLYNLASKLQTLYQKGIRTPKEINFQEIINIEQKFHLSICYIADNKYVTRMYEEQLNSLFRYRSFIVFISPRELFQELEKDHLLLCDALKLGDRLVAEANAKRHLHISHKHYVTQRLFEKYEEKNYIIK